ncbi:MAG: adenine deaminase [Nitrospirota bacterium]|nr:adenine deaminase [Nitrospirota bacterium]
MTQAEKVSGNIVDVVNSTIYHGTLEISGGRITDIIKDNKTYDTFIIPGLIDAHLHIESTMLIPSEFAKIAVIHGTVATVSDPHEIANILGIEGVDYMIENGKTVPFKFYFGAPSCVPATPLETSGAKLGILETEELLKREDIKYLSEMMNFPGVLNEDPEVMAKIGLAKKYKKRIDGHAPRLSSKDLKKYVQAGITTDHETVEKEEALEKIKFGMKILIREGSAAKNFDTLRSLTEDYPDFCMFCTDDKHPDELVQGHIDELVRRALYAGYDKMKVLQCATVNPVHHYGLEVGLLQKGDYADFVIIDNFETFTILRTYINGQLVAENSESLIPTVKAELPNKFKAKEKKGSDFAVKKGGEKITVIEAIDGQVITNRMQEVPKISDGYVVSDTKRDILKLTVVNRYRDFPPAVAFVKNFGLKKGAIASSVAHDSHNIVAVGVSDKDITKAVNLIIENKGGLAVVYDDIEEILPLPIAGIMSNEDCFTVAEKYSQIDKLAKDLGSLLRAPFMTLSFMALLVIPQLKLSDKGLFDGEKFKFVNLFE